MESGTTPYHMLLHSRQGDRITTHGEKYLKDAVSMECRRAQEYVYRTCRGLMHASARDMYSAIFGNYTIVSIV